MINAPLNKNYDSDGGSDNEAPQRPKTLRGKAKAITIPKADTSAYERGPGNDLGAVAGQVKPRLKQALVKSERNTKTAMRRLARAEMLDTEQTPGYLEADEGEKTHTIRQDAIVAEVDVQTARKRYDLCLPTLGPYVFDYSTNGGGLVILGHRGHMACVKWKTFSLQSETQLKERCYDAAFLHDDQLYAVAQKKYTYIYGHDGVEVHQLRTLAEVRKLEYLPQHFLLAGGSSTGILTWFDVSTGALAGMQRTRLGEVQALRRDPSNNILAVGHTNGLVSMWSPKAGEALVKIATHRGALVDLTIDKSGRYLVTLGVDSYTRVWDLRMMQSTHQYPTPVGAAVDISHTGLLAIGLGHRVEVWKDALQTKQQKPYMAHNFDSALTQIQRVKFCPYEDVLGVGHSFGFSSYIIPGSGCAAPDFFQANVFESKKQQKERPIHNLLDKLPPDSIGLGKTIGVSQIEPAKKTLKARQAARAQEKQEEGGIADNGGKPEDDDDSDPDKGVIDSWQSQKAAEERVANKNKLERQRKEEKRMNKMEGTEKYKLKQRTQGRREVRLDRRRLKREKIRGESGGGGASDGESGRSDGGGGSSVDEDVDEEDAAAAGPSAALNRFQSKGFKRVKKK